MAKKQIINMRRWRRIRLIDSMNSWVGSWAFLVVHILWFVIWLAWQWDINLLTMIVSLEAIVLMIILLMAQNRQSMRDDLRDEADLQADLQSVELTNKVLKEVRLIKKEIKNLKYK
jgi:uncharacterized membrane protein